MGRPRKLLSNSTRHNTKSEIAEHEMIEAKLIADRDQLVRPPVWMKNKIAVKEWKRIVPEILKNECIGNLDLTSIAGYCIAFSNYREVSDQIEKLKMSENEEEASDMLKWIGAQTTCASEMRRFGGLCGLTLDSRLKAAAQKLKEEHNDISDKFGDI